MSESAEERKYVELGTRKLYLNDHGSVIGPHGVVVTASGIITLGLEVKTEVVPSASVDVRTLTRAEFDLAAGHLRSAWQGEQRTLTLEEHRRRALLAALKSLGIEVVDEPSDT